MKNEYHYESSSLSFPQLTITINNLRNIENILGKYNLFNFYNFYCTK